LVTGLISAVGGLMGLVKGSVAQSLYLMSKGDFIEHVMRWTYSH